MDSGLPALCLPLLSNGATQVVECKPIPSAVTILFALKSGRFLALGSATYPVGNLFKCNLIDFTLR